MEDKLVRIVAFFEVYSEEKREEYIEREEMNRVRDLQIQIERELKQNREDEKNKLEKLLKFSNDLDEAKKIGL